MNFLIALVAGLVAVNAAGPDKKDTLEVKADSRNMMLNAESATVPREINVGLPESGNGAVVYVDGTKHAAGIPKSSYHWAGGNAYEPVGSISFMESVIKTGEIGVCVDSHTKLGTDLFRGDITAKTSINGLIHFDGAVSGPICKQKGLYFSAGAYVRYDPTSVNAPNRPFVDQRQAYQASITKRWGKEAELSLIYRFSRCDDNDGGGYSVAPFIYNGDGSVSEAGGFRIGRDCYFPGDDAVSYMDLLTGEMKYGNLSKMDRRSLHDISLKGKLNTDGGWCITSTLHACLMPGSEYAQTNLAGISKAAASDSYSTSDGKIFVGNLQSRYVYAGRLETYDVIWLSEAAKRLGMHKLKTGLELTFADQSNESSTFSFAHTVSANPVRINRNGKSTWDFNTNALYLKAKRYLAAFYAFDDWTVSDRWFLRFGLRLKPGFQDIRTAANMEGDGKINKRVQNFVISDPNLCKIHNLKRFGLDYAASLHADYRIAGRLFAMAEGFYSMTNKSTSYYRNASIPSEKPIGNALARCGLNYDNTHFDGSLLFSFITAWNCALLTNVSRGSVTIPWTAQYGIKTPGLTFDGNLHYGGFRLHALVTYQDPRYYNFAAEFDFSDGKPLVIDYNDKVVTGISKLLLEIDPSYSWKRVKVWASIRYNSRQYASRTNLAYFKGHFETFAGADWKINDHNKLSLDFVNLLCQNGVKGSISIADVITDPAELNGYLMSGSFIRPFSMELKYNFSF